jgi:hypothetical protein
MKTKQQRIIEKQKELIDHFIHLPSDKITDCTEWAFKRMDIESELSALEAEPDSEQPRPTREQIIEVLKTLKRDGMGYIIFDYVDMLEVTIKILALYPEQPIESNAILYNGTLYWYEKRLAKNGDVCLATKNPKEYCNGLFSYSSKDPGDGLEYVVINATHPEQPSEKDIERWANSKESIIEAMPETLKLHIRKKIECRIEGAKAVLNGQIPVSK